MRLECSARIPNEEERRAVMMWVRMVANVGYSEVEDTVRLIYEGDPASDDGQYWGIIHTFENYAEHTITSNES